jgi:hypothetical protein
VAILNAEDARQDWGPSSTPGFALLSRQFALYCKVAIPLGVAQATPNSIRSSDPKGSLLFFDDALIRQVTE